MENLGLPNDIIRSLTIPRHDDLYESCSAYDFDPKELRDALKDYVEERYFDLFHINFLLPFKSSMLNLSINSDSSFGTWHIWTGISTRVKPQPHRRQMLLLVITGFYKQSVLLGWKRREDLSSLFINYHLLDNRRSTHFFFWYWKEQQHTCLPWDHGQWQSLAFIYWHM